MARAAAEAAAAAAVAAERSSSFYAGSGSEGNAYYALHDESGSCEYESNIIEHGCIQMFTRDLKSAGFLILIGPQLYPLRMVIFCDLYNKLLELDPQLNSPQARR